MLKKEIISFRKKKKKKQHYEECETTFITSNVNLFVKLY